MREVSLIMKCPNCQTDNPDNARFVFIVEARWCNRKLLLI
jgi:hypothetical protein